MIKLKKVSDEKYVIANENGSLLVTESDLMDLMDLYDRESYIEDVRFAIEENNITVSDEDFECIVNNYCELRKDAEGDADGMPWNYCLQEAFDMNGIAIPL